MLNLGTPNDILGFIEMSLVSKEIFLTQLFAEFERTQLDYFIFGEYESLPTDTGGSDIDIIVSCSDAHKLIQTLVEVVDKNDIKLASFYRNSQELMFRFLTFEWGVQIDVLSGGLYYRGIPYYPWENLKQHVVIYNGIRVLEKQYGYFVGFFKDVIHNAHAKQKYCDAILHAIQVNELDVKREVETCFAKDTWEIIHSNASSVEALNHSGKQIRQSILRYRKNASLIKSLSYYVRRIGRLFHPKPGYVIVVEGTDGSGKSTIINALNPWLNECFHKTVEYNHLRPHLLLDIGVILGKRKADETVTVVENPHSESKSGIVGSLIRWMYYLHDYTWGYIVKVYPKIKTRSYIYIFDRYYYDYYIDPQRSLISLPYWILRIGEYVLPKPDIILCLGGDPEKIYARKPETSLEEVTRQTEELKRFVTNRKNAVWIDTSQPLESSLNVVKTVLLTILSKRFSNPR